jgi:outer membrane protein assembly factor BamA
VAQGGVQTNPVWGTSGGAVLAFSDLLGDDRLLVTFYSADVPGRRFVDGLNVGLTRVHLGRRANVGYGAFRYSGLRYDRTDPDADATYPVLFEQLAGGFGVVSYPLSRFQRVEVTGSLAFNRKEVTFAQVERDALLYTQHLALTHDNALYGYNGPLDGWKAQVGAGYTTDLRYSNVSYYTLSADVRRYTRLFGDVSLASWGLVRTNVGREARLFLLGGSWDLRGFPFLRVRGQNQWFTSHELRFPIAYAPSAYVPLLAPFGILNLRGALFADAAHAWNDGYRQREPQLLTGRTLGAVGGGLRMNLFGGIVLRYDLGWRFEDGLDWGERRPFRQFFFGYDF